MARRPGAAPGLVEGTLPDFRRVVRGGLGAGRTELAAQLRLGGGASEAARQRLLRLAMARGWPADSRCLYVPMAAQPARAVEAAAALRSALPDAALAYVRAQPLRLSLAEAPPQQRGRVLLFPLAVRLRCHASLLDAANEVVGLAGNPAVSRCVRRLKRSPAAVGECRTGRVAPAAFGEHWGGRVGTRGGGRWP